MLDKDTVYRKTQRGTEALATRHGGLTPRQRSLMILIDGRRNGEELNTLGAACGDVAELMQALEAEGYVERTGPAAAPAEPPRSTTAPTVPLAQLRTQAVRRLTDMLGPSAEDLCMKVEKAQTLQEFRATVRRVEATLQQVVGARRAAEFISEMEKLGGT